MMQVGTELLSGFERLKRLALVGTLVGCTAIAAACGTKAPGSGPSGCAPNIAGNSAEALPGISEFSPEPTWVQDFTQMPNGMVDEEKWHYELDPVVPTYNDEAQAYTKDPRNVRVDCGRLVLEAHREDYAKPDGSPAYTSGRIDTRDSLNFEYGKVEVTMTLPEGAGAWPAFWFLSANNPYTTALDPTDEDWEQDRFYLHDGELDGMEAGEDGQTHKIDFTAHTFAKSFNKHVNIPDASTTPHTYGVEVTPTHITWTVDGKRYFTFKKPSNNPDKWPFGKGNKFYLILNLALGGNYAGKIDPDQDNWRMEIFGVKYYRYTGAK